MSDEPSTPPPALRLKPRLKPVEPESPSAAPAAASPPPPPAAPSDPEPPKARLIVSPGTAEPAAVVAEAAEPAVGVSPPPPLPAPPEEAAPAEAVSAPPPPASAPVADAEAEAVRFRLKAKVGAPPAPATAEGAPKLPPFPVLAPPSAGKITPPIPHLTVTPEAPGGEPPVPANPEQRRAFKVGVAGAGLAALLVLGAGGYFVWTKFISPPPPPVAVAAKPRPATPPPVASSVATKPAAPLPPADPASAPAPIPVNAINKAQAVVSARGGGEQASRDAITAGQDLPEQRVANPAPPAAPAGAKAAKGAAAATKPAATVSATLAPGILATSSEVDAVAEATPAFRAFVANAKITGVIGGIPAKIILNGRLARSGDLVDSALGVTFDSIDAERKLLVFKEASGAIVTRKY